ncbi:uncharacterized protein [Dermacentor albipictus]|uniref:uncharacterized protein n=1 Tax=Dermacentor albipictus TaxID=60249 RepID=UPI0038FCBA78
MLRRILLFVQFLFGFLATAGPPPAVQDASSIPEQRIQDSSRPYLACPVFFGEDSLGPTAADFNLSPFDYVITDCPILLFLFGFLATAGPPPAVQDASSIPEQRIQDSSRPYLACPVFFGEDSLGPTAADFNLSPFDYVITDCPILLVANAVTSAPATIRAAPLAAFFSGQGDSNAATMLRRILLFVQVCHFNNAYCIRSDDPFLLLLPCPRCCNSCFAYISKELVHLVNSLLLSGDIETNPGPPRRNPQANTELNSQSGCAPTLDRSPAAVADTHNVGDMFAQLLAGQNRIAQDIANLKTSVDSRFKAFESRLASLESSFSASGSVSDDVQNKILALPATVNRLVTQNDELEACLSQNNFKAVSSRLEDLDNRMTTAVNTPAVSDLCTKLQAEVLEEIPYLSDAVVQLRNDNTWWHRESEQASAQHAEAIGALRAEVRVLRDKLAKERKPSSLTSAAVTPAHSSKATMYAVRQARGGSKSLDSGSIFSLPDGPELVFQLRTFENRLPAAPTPMEKVPCDPRSWGGVGKKRSSRLPLRW